MDQVTRDALMEALGALHGGLNGMTPRMKRQVGVALADIRQATPDVTPEEIAKRAANYRRLDWNARGARPSAMALAKWWGDCAEDSVPQRFEDVDWGAV